MIPLISTWLVNYKIKFIHIKVKMEKLYNENHAE